MRCTEDTILLMGGRSEPREAHGVYSYAEAARLLRVPSARVSRWADGYTFKRKYDHGVSGPLLQTERRQKILSFHELWELMFVKEFIGLGVPLPQIRETAENLAREVGAYPFSSSKLLVQGRQLLVKAADGLHRGDVGQLVADYAEQMAVYVEIRQDRVGRYNVPEYNQVVYLDKDVRWGEPSVSPRAIPTRIVFELYAKEQDLESVADYYELDAKHVSAAIRFESEWRLAA